MFGKRLRILRDLKNLTQKNVGDLPGVGVTQQAVDRWEKGQSYPDAMKLSAIADFFGVTTDYLLGRDQKLNNVIDLAAHRTDDPMSDLPEDAKKSVEEFIAYVKAKYQTKK